MDRQYRPAPITTLDDTMDSPPMPLSPGMQARFSELVNIVVQSTKALHEEFDFVTPEMWEVVMDQLFPEGDTLQTQTSATTDSFISPYMTGGTTSQLLKIHMTKQQILNAKPGPEVAPPDAPTTQLTPKQRGAEWQMIIHYGDVRANMSPDQLASAHIALKRWWSWVPNMEVFVRAREAACAACRLLGGRLWISPWDTEVWRKAKHDSGLDEIRTLKAGDNEGITSIMEIFLGFVPKPAPENPTQQVRGKNTKPSATKQAAKRKSGTKEPVTDKGATTGLKGAGSSKLQQQQVPKSGKSQRDIEPPSIAEGFMTKMSVENINNEEEGKVMVGQHRPHKAVQQQQPSELVPSPAARPYKYNHEADLTANPRINALIAFLLAKFSMRHRVKLTRYPAACEMLIKYAKKKEKYLIGPQEWGTYEGNFWDGKDLEWTWSGYKLDTLMEKRQKALAEERAAKAGENADDKHERDAIDKDVNADRERSKMEEQDTTVVIKDDDNAEADVSDKERGKVEQGNVIATENIFQGPATDKGSEADNEDNDVENSKDIAFLRSSSSADPIPPHGGDSRIPRPEAIDKLELPDIEDTALHEHKRSPSISLSEPPSGTNMEPNMTAAPIPSPEAETTSAPCPSPSPLSLTADSNNHFNHETGDEHHIPPNKPSVHFADEDEKATEHATAFEDDEDIRAAEQQLQAEADGANDIMMNRKRAAVHEGDLMAAHASKKIKGGDGGEMGHGWMSQSWRMLSRGVPWSTGGGNGRG